MTMSSFIKQDWLVTLSLDCFTENLCTICLNFVGWWNSPLHHLMMLPWGQLVGRAASIISEGYFRLCLCNFHTIFHFSLNFFIHFLPDCRLINLIGMLAHLMMEKLWVLSRDFARTISLAVMLCFGKVWLFVEFSSVYIRSYYLGSPEMQILMMLSVSFLVASTIHLQFKYLSG